MYPDHKIRSKIESGQIIVSPYDSRLVQPASLDLRLGNKFIRYLDNGEPIDPELDDNGIQRFVADKVVLYPREFILGTTLEVVGIDPSISSRVEGKSTLGRLGLIIHSTAGFVDPGFKGKITLEMTNINHRPIILWAGMKICQLSFTPMESPSEIPYGDPRLGSHYQGQDDVTPASALKWLSLVE